jgi:hypothetical protein
MASRCQARTQSQSETTATSAPEVTQGAECNSERVSALTSGAPSIDPGVIAAAEASLGTSFADVRFRGGEGVAESNDAAAVSRGREVFVHPEAMEADGSVAPELIWHELVHAAQSEMPATPGQEGREGEADAGMEAIASGAAYDVALGTGGTAVPQCWKLDDWLSGSDNESKYEEADEGAVVTTEESLAATEDGEVIEIETELKSEETGSGSSQSLTETAELGSDHQSVTSVEESTTTAKGTGTTDTTTVSNTTQELDREKMTADAKANLETNKGVVAGELDVASADLKAAEQKLEAVQAERVARETAPAEAPSTEVASEEVVEVDAGASEEAAATETAAPTTAGDSTASDSDAEADLASVEEEEDRLLAEVEALRQKEATLQADLESVDADLARLNEDTVTDVVDEAKLDVEPTYKDVDGASNTESTTVDTDLSDGTVGKSTSDSTTLHTEDGSVTTENTSGAELDLNEGTATATTGEKTVVATDDGTATQASSESVAVGIEDGIKVTGTTNDSTEVRDADGQLLEGESSETTASGQVIIKEDEVGLGGSAGTTSTKSAGGDSDALSGEVSGQVTNKGASGEAAATSKNTTAITDEEGVEQGSVSLDMGTKVFGGFEVDIAELPGTEPTQYQIVCTLTFGMTANAGLSGEQAGEEGASAGVSGSATVSGGMVYRHTMSEEEAGSYMKKAEALDASGKADSAEPEFVVLADWRAGVDAMGDGGAEAMMAGVDSEAASNMAAGDSLEVTLGASAEGKVEGDTGVVGASLEGSTGFTRTVKVAGVTVEGLALVDVTVTEQVASSAGGSASVDPGAVSGEGGLKTTTTAGESVTLRLDPKGDDYDAVYNALLAAGSGPELKAVADKYPQFVQGAVSSSGDSSTTSASVSAGGASAEIEMGDTYEEEVAQDADGNLSVEVNAGQSTSGTLKVGDTEVVKNTDEDNVQVSVDAQGNEEIVLTEVEAHEDISNTEDIDSAADVAAGPLKALLDAEELKLVTELKLSSSDVTAMYGMAGDKDRWFAAADYEAPQLVLTQWSDLRDAINSPKPDAEMMTQDPDNAPKIYRAQAVGRFIQDTGDTGRRVMTNLVREGEGPDLGDLSQWPPSLAETKGKYDSLMASSAGLQDKLNGYLSDGNVVEGESYGLSVVAGLQGVYDAILSAEDFTSQRAQSEMLEAVATSQLQAESVYNSFLSAAGLGTCDVDASDADIALEEGEFGESTDPDALALVESKLRLLGDFPKLAREIENDLATFYDSWSYTLNLASSFEDEMILDRAVQLTEQWVNKVWDVRSAYETAGVPAEEWAVSSNQGDARNGSYEPDWNSLIALYDSENTVANSNIGSNLKKMCVY